MPDSRERQVYEHTPIEYARLMTGLLRNAERREADELVDSLKPLVQGIRELWPSPDAMPPEIAELTGLVDGIQPI